jgi:hypothetical protein
VTLYAIGGILFLGALSVGIVYLAGKKAGVNAAVKEVFQADVKAGERIAEADARAPGSRADLVERLRNGSGL